MQNNPIKALTLSLTLSLCLWTNPAMWISRVQVKPPSHRTLLLHLCRKSLSRDLNLYANYKTFAGFWKKPTFWFDIFAAVDWVVSDNVQWSSCRGANDIQCINPSQVLHWNIKPLNCFMFYIFLFVVHFRTIQNGAVCSDRFLSLDESIAYWAVIVIISWSDGRKRIRASLGTWKTSEVDHLCQ